MGTRNERLRTLWLILVVGFAISLFGAAFLFIPTLEFFAVDVIEKLGLPIGLVANIAMIADFALFILCALGLIAMSIRSLIAKTR